MKSFLVHQRAFSSCIAAVRGAADLNGWKMALRNCHALLDPVRGAATPLLHRSAAATSITASDRRAAVIRSDAIAAVNVAARDEGWSAWSAWRGVAAPSLSRTRSRIAPGAERKEGQERTTDQCVRGVVHPGIM